MNFDLKNHLKTLCELHAPSGYEDAARYYLREVWSPWVESFQVEGLGSLIAYKPGQGAGPRPKIMLSAHMDEIGMVVTEVRQGYLRLGDLAGMDGRILQGKGVMVHGQRPLSGTIAAVPPHISNSTGEGKSTYPSLDQQWVDLGLPAEEVAALVSIGDVVTLDAPLIELKGGLLAGKAMDNRACVAAISQCLWLLQKRLHQWDVYAVASTQEEKGWFGGVASAQMIQPDLCIVLDVTFAKQPGVNDDTAPALGKGVPISIGANFQPQWVKLLEGIAKDHDIPYSLDPLPAASGTEAWGIQLANQGIPCALLNIPVRNMHTGVETVSLKDIQRAGRWLAEAVTALDEQTLDELAWKTDVSDDNDNKEDS
jgi:endoglucanase